MSSYIDGFVLPIPKQHLDKYKQLATVAQQVWKDHGALDYWECVGEDLASEHSRSFTDMLEAGDDEVVIFAWAVFASRAARDAANEKIMADERMTALMDPEKPLFDCKRMAHGGFDVLVHD